MKYLPKCSLIFCLLALWIYNPTISGQKKDLLSRHTVYKFTHIENDSIYLYIQDETEYAFDGTKDEYNAIMYPDSLINYTFKVDTIFLTPLSASAEASENLERFYLILMYANENNYKDRFKKSKLKLSDFFELPAIINKAKVYKSTKGGGMEAFVLTEKLKLSCDCNISEIFLQNLSRVDSLIYELDVFCGKTKLGRIRIIPRYVNQNPLSNLVKK